MIFIILINRSGTLDRTRVIFREKSCSFGSAPNCDIIMPRLPLELASIHRSIETNYCWLKNTLPPSTTPDASNILEVNILQKVPPGHQFILDDGDTLNIGGKLFRFEQSPHVNNVYIFGDGEVLRRKFPGLQILTHPSSNPLVKKTPTTPSHHTIPSFSNAIPRTPTRVPLERVAVLSPSAKLFTPDSNTDPLKTRVETPDNTPTKFPNIHPTNASTNINTPPTSQLSSSESTDTTTRKPRGRPKKIVVDTFASYAQKPNPIPPAFNSEEQPSESPTKKMKVSENTTPIRHNLTPTVCDYRSETTSTNSHNAHNIPSTAQSTSNKPPIPHNTLNNTNKSSVSDNINNKDNHSAKTPIDTSFDVPPTKNETLTTLSPTIQKIIELLPPTSLHASTAVQLAVLYNRSPSLCLGSSHSLSDGVVKNIEESLTQLARQSKKYSYSRTELCSHIYSYIHKLPLLFPDPSQISLSATHSSSQIGSSPPCPSCCFVRQVHTYTVIVKKEDFVKDWGGVSCNIPRFWAEIVSFKKESSEWNPTESSFQSEGGVKIKVEKTTDDDFQKKAPQVEEEEHIVEPAKRQQNETYSSSIPPFNYKAHNPHTPSTPFAESFQDLDLPTFSFSQEQIIEPDQPDTHIRHNPPPPISSPPKVKKKDTNHHGTKKKKIIIRQGFSVVFPKKKLKYQQPQQPPQHIITPSFSPIPIQTQTQPQTPIQTQTQTQTHVHTQLRLSMITLWISMFLCNSPKHPLKFHASTVTPIPLSILDPEGFLSSPLSLQNRICGAFFYNQAGKPKPHDYLDMHLILKNILRGRYSKFEELRVDVLEMFDRFTAGWNRVHPYYDMANELLTTFDQTLSVVTIKK